MHLKIYKCEQLVHGKYINALSVFEGRPEGIPANPSIKLKAVNAWNPSSLSASVPTSIYFTYMKSAHSNRILVEAHLVTLR